MGYVFFGMTAVILGLTIMCILLWTALREEQARNFNARLIARLQEQTNDPQETRVFIYDQDDD